MKRKLALGLLVLLASARPSLAVPLNVVTVGAPSVNCVFDPTCTITVSDTIATIPIAAGGTNFLQSRTFTGKPGAPGDGLFGNEYRIDLTNAVSAGPNAPCIRSLTVKIGSVVGTLDYNGDGVPLDHVYVVTQGGLGSVGVSSAELDTAGNVTFTFSPSVCPGASPGTGQTTYFFGLASKQPPQALTASVTEVGGAVHQVDARAPGAGPACSIPPYSPNYWNDGGTVQFGNNCYNYGNNRRTDTFAQPGRAAGAQAASMACADVTNAAVADGLTSTTAAAACPAGMSKIAMVVDPGHDYHWYRLGTNGMWTHKPGGTQATNLDNSMLPISNPETANRCGGGLCYTDFCGYFCTCSDEQQGQGHANIQ